MFSVIFSKSGAIPNVFEIPETLISDAIRHLQYDGRMHDKCVSLPKRLSMKLFGKLFLATSLLVSCMQAGIIFDNTAGATISSNTIQSLGPLYVSFTTASDVEQLTDLKLILSLNPGATGSINIGLYFDDSTAPGSLIVNLGALSDSSLTSAPTLYDVALFANPQLAPDTRYWIGLSGTTSASWSWSLDTSGTGVANEFFANKDGVLPNKFGPYQMSLTTDISAPEPGSFLLLVAALSALIFLRRRLTA
jgi:hypothetical protein